MEKLGSSLEMSGKDCVVGHLLGLPVELPVECRELDVELILPWRETSWQGLFRLGHPSSMGPTSSIPHSCSLLCKDCSLWLELSAAGVEIVAGYLVEGSRARPS